MSWIGNNVTVGNEDLDKSPVDKSLSSLVRMRFDKVNRYVIRVGCDLELRHYGINESLSTLKRAGILDSDKHGNKLERLCVRNLVVVLVLIKFTRIKCAVEANSLAAKLELEELIASLFEGLGSPAHAILNALEGKNIVL